MKDSSFELTSDEFFRLTELIYRRSGIRFEPKKMYFISKRVQSRIEELGLSSVGEYIRLLRFGDKEGLEFQNLINLLTVNETYFFRDFKQLQNFAEICLPDVVERKAAHEDYSLRIWSAGCSTGEEPYTLAIILLELFEDISLWDVQIVATDIDKNVLAKCRQGIYGPRSVKDVPQEYLEAYFSPMGQDKVLVRPEVRSLVSFEHLNLSDRLALRRYRNFDFIFCRNVLIYFDQVSRKRVVDHFYLALNKGGYIFLSSSESLSRISTAFTLKRMEGALVYTKA